MWILQFMRDYSIVWMFAVFVLILAVTFWPGRQARFDRDARIPLRDDC